MANSLGNQYKSGKMTSPANYGEIFIQNPGSVLVLFQDKNTTMKYDGKGESIRIEHKLIGTNRMQYGW